jgi:hypothetical protein
MTNEEIVRWEGVQTVAGLTGLFRYALRTGRKKSVRKALDRLEKRLLLQPYQPQLTGTLNDQIHELHSMGENERFSWVYNRIWDALSHSERLADEVVRDIVKSVGPDDAVRFSFAPALLPCLRYAQIQRFNGRGIFRPYAIRYSGVGKDVHLIAFASLFLGLSIYVESRAPWSPEPEIDLSETNEIEWPDVEVSFPPPQLAAADYPDFEHSIRQSQIPRAVDRGRYAIECIMLGYLERQSSRAVVFVSKNLISSTRQSCLRTRQSLISSGRVARVTELTEQSSVAFAGADHFVELNHSKIEQHEIWMTRAKKISQVLGGDVPTRQLISKSQRVPPKDIEAAGHTFAPNRYIANSRGDGGGILVAFRDLSNPTNSRLADYFEIIRPKATKHDPVGEFDLWEVRASNLSGFGEIEGTYRHLTVRQAKMEAIAEQKVRKDDILFAHRGPIGRVSYVRDAPQVGHELWASQSLMIIRQKARKASSKFYCDRKALFLYLLNEGVRHSWSIVAVGDRSPAIPIGEIERRGLPNNLITEVKRLRSTKILGDDNGIDSLIKAEFQAYEECIADMNEAKRALHDSLERVMAAAKAIEC